MLGGGCQRSLCNEWGQVVPNDDLIALEDFEYSFKSILHYSLCHHVKCILKSVSFLDLIPLFYILQLLIFICKKKSKSSQV